jgi:hypothetical protein
MDLDFGRGNGRMVCRKETSSRDADAAFRSSRKSSIMKKSTENWLWVLGAGAIVFYFISSANAGGSDEESSGGGSSGGSSGGGVNANMGGQNFGINDPSTW